MPPQTVRHAHYVRISDDPEGQRLGVGRQREDLIAYSRQQGAVIVEPYEDNDISASAYGRKVRPGYRRMLADAKAGAFDVIVAYTASRLTRKMREHEDHIALAVEQGIRFEFIRSPSFDLNTADGRMVARMIAAADTGEVERTSERILRAQVQRAAAGKRHGRLPYGWTITGDGRQVASPLEAPVVREIAQRLLAGESTTSLAEQLAARGITMRGRPFRREKFADLMLRPANVGLLVRRKKVVGPGDWEPILDRGLYDQLTVLLTNPRRRTNATNTRSRHLLTGIAKCGLCRGGVSVALRTNHPTNPGPAYFCSSCSGVMRKQAPVDQMVVTAVTAAAAQPQAAARYFGGQPDELAAALDELRSLEARRKLAASSMIRGDLDEDAYEELMAELRVLVEAASVRRDKSAPVNRLATWMQPQLRELWDDADRGPSLDVKRALVDAVLEIVILPRRSASPVFDPETVQLRWKV
jgi:site-specific DNA recombinase